MNEEPRSPAGQQHQYCTFYVNNLFLGISVQQVQEVIRYQEMTRVPRAPASIRGLINLRGQIVTAIDLRCWLGMPERDSQELPMNVIVRDGSNAVSLLVDRIGDVIEVDESLFEPPPSTVEAGLRGLIEGAYKLPDGLLLLLDTERALDECDTRSSQTARAAG
ncbi:MAG: chemotaxis protein CheW [Planctomycetaceae bacterium]